MTQEEKQARNLIIKDIMQSQKVSKSKAQSIIQELEAFGLIQFNAAGQFMMKVGI